MRGSRGKTPGSWAVGTPSQLMSSQSPFFAFLQSLPFEVFLSNSSLKIYIYILCCWKRYNCSANRSPFVIMTSEEKCRFGSGALLHFYKCVGIDTSLRLFEESQGDAVSLAIKICTDVIACSNDILHTVADKQ